MLLTNHTLTGLVLSQVIDDPLVLTPTAFASHLAVDTIPHFGMNDRWPFKSRPWFIIATIDNLIALSVTIGFLIAQPERRLQIVVGVGFACLPDLLFFSEILFNKTIIPPFRRFHSRLQVELPRGILIELLWAIAMAYILSRLVQ